MILDARFCTTCGEQSDVMDCRPSQKGFRRRRKCPKCGIRWRTLEVRYEQLWIIDVVDRFDALLVEMKAVEQKFADLQNMLKEPDEDLGN